MLVSCMPAAGRDAGDLWPPVPAGRLWANIGTVQRGHSPPGEGGRWRHRQHHLRHGLNWAAGAGLGQRAGSAAGQRLDRRAAPKANS
jgi:hypothetical protein